MTNLKPEEARDPISSNKRKATDKDVMEIFESFAVNVVEIGIEPRVLACLLDVWINQIAEQAAGPDRPEWTEKHRLLMHQFRKFKVTPVPEAELRERCRLARLQALTARHDSSNSSEGVIDGSGKRAN